MVIGDGFWTSCCPQCCPKRALADRILLDGIGCSLTRTEGDLKVEWMCSYVLLLQSAEGEPNKRIKLPIGQRLVVYLSPRHQHLGDLALSPDMRRVCVIEPHSQLATADLSASLLDEFRAFC